MPTATLTKQESSATTTAVLPLKPASTPPATASSIAATLRSLYPRAAKAFLKREFSLTHSLLTSAFSILEPPSSPADDTLASYRRKWDILRITLETTFYVSPPTTDKPEALPAALRANQMLSAQSLVTNLHARSLELFTPSIPPQTPSSAFLPHQVLVTLVLASIKLGCPVIGRGIVEDWLARREHPDSADEPGGYPSVLELYCLQILPRLEEWDYAQDFLRYETELPQDTRIQMISSIRALHEQAIAARRPPLVPTPTLEVPSPESSRSVSPSPSLSASSAASESTNSTHTATPLSPRPVGDKRNTRLHNTASLPQAPSASTSSQSGASITTSRTVTPSSAHHTATRPNSERGVKRGSRGTPDGTISPLPRPPRSPSLQRPSAATASPPSTLTVLRSYLNATLLSASKSKLTTFLLLFVIFPLVSFFLRSRRRRMIAAADASTAEEVRRRLKGIRGGSLGGLGGTGLAGRLWNEATRVVMDTVTMGGRGLV